jgi:hypothetical protein
MQHDINALAGRDAGNLGAELLETLAQYIRG